MADSETAKSDDGQLPTMWAADQARRYQEKLREDAIAKAMQRDSAPAAAEFGFSDTELVLAQKQKLAHAAYAEMRTRQLAGAALYVGVPLGVLLAFWASLVWDTGAADLFERVVGTVLIFAFAASWIAMLAVALAFIAYTAVADRMSGAPKPLKPDVASRLKAFELESGYYAEASERKLRSFWENLEGHSFELELARLLRARGYQATATPASGDNGVDIWAERDRQKTAIQCKRYCGAVGPAVVRELYGAMLHHKVDRGVVATTGYFTQGAVEFAAGKQIELWTLDEILRLQSS